MEFGVEALKQSLNKAFIDRHQIGSIYDPSLIINQPDKGQYLLTVLQDEALTSQSFFFSVAFITQDGLNGLKTQLADLARKGVSGRLLTSNYLSFNHPDMFDSLMQIPNLEVRISEKKGFHAKGYLFNHRNHDSLIIGSSNLTMSALKLNYEWNIKLTSLSHGEIIYQIEKHLESEWDFAKPLTSSWIKKYREDYLPMQQILQAEVIQEKSSNVTYISPNKMQKVALERIQAVRESGEK